MNRADCINHLRAGHPMTHRVSRIIADMLEADALALASAEESNVLRTLADMREALGVGEKPMLDELPGLVRAVVAEREELARRVRILAGGVLRDTTHMCGGKDYCNGCGANVTNSPKHYADCPVDLAKHIAKEAGNGR